MMPKAGGQYVYLREAYSPLWGFLYGWTLFLVIQTGTIAAVAVGFARFLGVMWPAISPNTWVVSPIALSDKYAISLSVQQLVALLLILFLDRAQYPRAETRETDSEYFHFGENARACRSDPCWNFSGPERGGDSRQFQRPLDAARSADDPARRRLDEIVHSFGDRGFRNVWPAHCVRSFAGGIAVFRGRLEQHHVHRRRSEKSKARHSRFAGRRHGDRHHALFPGQSWIPFHAHAAPDSDGAGRPRRHRHAGRDFRPQRRDADGAGDHDLHVRLRQRPDPCRRARVLRDVARRIVFSRALAS